MHNKSWKDNQTSKFQENIIVGVTILLSEMLVIQYLTWLGL